MKKNFSSKTKKDPVCELVASACCLVQKELGPGFIPKIYLNAMKIVLQKMKLSFRTDDEFWVAFDKEIIGKFRVDIVVENKVMVQLKVIDGRMPGAYDAQMRSYLRAAHLTSGLLVNFGSRKCELRRITLP
jgi:GxxExxY protein